MSAKENRKGAEPPTGDDAEARRRAAAGNAGEAARDEEPLDEESLDHVLREAPL